MTREEAIETIRKNMPSDKSLPIYEAIQTLIPELKKSEDEKIRKAIIKSIEEGSSVYEQEVSKEQMLAWLEKLNLSDLNLLKEFNKGMQEAIMWGREGYEVSPDGKVKSLTQDEIDSVLEKQKEQNGEDEECTDFTIYHPLKNGKGKYECIPYSFYGSLTSFSDRKDLMDFLHNCFYTKKECDEWIEKQKEQKTIDYEAELKKCKDNPLYLYDKYMSIKLKSVDDKVFEEWIDDWWKHNKVNNPDSYDKGDEIQFDECGFKNFCRGIRNMYQQKPADLPAGFYVTLPGGEKYYAKEMRCNGMNVKVVEPKPAEWDEFDEDCLKRAVWYIENPAPSVVKDTNLVLWLKSLPKRFNLEPKQEWSEEDEDAINGAIGILLDDNNPSFVFPEHSKLSVGEIVKRLKSLRPQPKKNSMITPNKEFFQWIYDRLVNVHNEDPNVDYMISFKKRIEESSWKPSEVCYGPKGDPDPAGVWKPSEEQMKAIKHAYNSFPNDCPTKSNLRLLYQDLKKLL